MKGLLIKANREVVEVDSSGIIGEMQRLVGGIHADTFSTGEGWAAVINMDGGDDLFLNTIVVDLLEALGAKMDVFGDVLFIGQDGDSFADVPSSVRDALASVMGTGTDLPHYPLVSVAERGLHVTVLRHADGRDYSARGISSRFTELTVVGIVDDRYGRAETPRAQRVKLLPEHMRANALTEKAPAAWLHIRQMGQEVIYTIIPVSGWNENPWVMAGGNFAYSSDSRFRELTGGLYGAVAIHDRIER